jgi:hypothetical protein
MTHNTSSGERDALAVEVMAPIGRRRV